VRVTNQTKSFGWAVKKLHSNEKKVLKEEVQKIKEDPSFGEEKKGDLSGVWVHKFTVKSHMYLVAYIFDTTTLTFIYFGSHENFYRDLKRIQ